jgi:hypothetical protein
MTEHLDGETTDPRAEMAAILGDFLPAGLAGLPIELHLDREAR